MCGQSPEGSGIWGVSLKGLTLLEMSKVPLASNLAQLVWPRKMDDCECRAEDIYIYIYVCTVMYSHTHETHVSERAQYM